MTHQQKLENAIQYLKQRNIYVLDGKYTPTTPESTDIKKTIARYKRETKNG